MLARSIVFLANTKRRKQKQRRKNPYILVWAMKTETEEYVVSENGDGSTSGLSKEASSARVVLTSQTLKCEPVMTEAQAETEGWSVSVSAPSLVPVNHAQYSSAIYFLFNLLVTSKTYLPYSV